MTTADGFVDEVVGDFFSTCAGDGEMMSEDQTSDWVHETLDGYNYNQLDDGDLITLADEGLDEQGRMEIGGKNGGGVRQALIVLAYYALSSKVNGQIYSQMRDYELEFDQKVANHPPLDSAPENYLDDLLLWRQPDWQVWQHVQELGLWIDRTDDNPPSAIDMMGEAIENS
jgi:hypothetical protein